MNHFGDFSIRVRRRHDGPAAGQHARQGHAGAANEYRPSPTALQDVQPVSDPEIAHWSDQRNKRGSRPAPAPQKTNATFGALSTVGSRYWPETCVNAGVLGLFSADIVDVVISLILNSFSLKMAASTVVCSVPALPASSAFATSMFCRWYCNALHKLLSVGTGESLG